MIFRSFLLDNLGFLCMKIINLIVIIELCYAFPIIYVNFFFVVVGKVTHLDA